MTASSGPSFDPAFRSRLVELFAWRRDVRRFRTDPLPPDLLPRLLEAADGAPSVGLSQPWRFVTVTDETRRAGIRAEFARSNAEALAAQPAGRAGLYARLKLAGLSEAPCQLAVFTHPDPAQGGGLGRTLQPATLDASSVLAIHTLWLLARAEGVGLGWVSILDPARVAALLDVPPDWRLVAYLCLGWPDAADCVPELEREGWETRRRTDVLRR